MQGLVVVVFFAATFADFLTTASDAPGAFKFLPEILSGVVLITVLAQALRSGLELLAIKYWLVFGLLIVIIVAGLLANEVGSGPTLSGMRYYIRAIPLFILPAVARFSEDDIRKQLKILLGIALFQLPVAVYQRYVILSMDRFSGDDVRGTVMDSGILSIILISGMLILTGFFMRGRIKKGPFLLLFFLLLFPTTINETKATVIFVPLGLFATIIAGSPRGKRLPIFFAGVGLMAAFGAILIPVYALMNANKPQASDKDLIGFFTDERAVDRYINGHAKKEVTIGSTAVASRTDVIRVPLQYLSQDPVHFAFGLGMGNVSHSSIGEQFTGYYYGLLGHFGTTTFSVFLLEIGILGTGLVFLLYFFVFSDAIAVAKLDTSLIGAIATGWIGVVPIAAVGSGYTLTHSSVPLSYLYWYFAGVIAARRVELAFLQHQSGALSTARRAAT